MDVHFHQSKAWQVFQESLGRRTFMRDGEGWHYLAILESSLGFKRLYCPYGPVATSVEAFENALASLRVLAREQQAAFLRIQPTGIAYSREYFKASKFKQIDFSQPSHTWLLDITPSTEELLAHMKQNNRNIYRNYAKKGLSYHQSSDPSDIHYLSILLAETAKHNRITVHSPDYFAAQAKALMPIEAARLHLIRHESGVIAAALAYEDNTTAYYAHAASSFEHRKLGAATALLAEMIFDAKARGKQRFDFYGISPSDRPNPRWAGFTAFKKSFGGYEKTYSETYEVPLRRMAYFAYNTLRLLTRTWYNLKRR